MEKWTTAYKPQYLLVILLVSFTVFSFPLPFLKEMRARHLSSAYSMSGSPFPIAHSNIDLPSLCVQKNAMWPAQQGEISFCSNSND